MRRLLKKSFGTIFRRQTRKKERKKEKASDYYNISRQRIFLLVKSLPRTYQVPEKEKKRKKEKKEKKSKEKKKKKKKKHRKCCYKNSMIAYCTRLRRAASMSAFSLDNQRTVLILTSGGIHDERYYMLSCACATPSPCPHNVRRRVLHSYRLCRHAFISAPPSSISYRCLSGRRSTAQDRK